MNDATALALLRQHLSPEQRTDLDGNRRFTEPTRSAGHITFTLTRWGVGVLDGDADSICIAAGPNLPIPAQALALLLCLRADEDGFLNTAGRDEVWP